MARDPPSHRRLRTAASPNVDADNVRARSLGRVLTDIKLRLGRVCRQLLAQLGQPELELHLLQVAFHRLRIEHGLLQQRQPRVGVFAQAFAVRLAALGRGTDQPAGVTKELRPRTRSRLQKRQGGVQLGTRDLRLGNLGPGIAELGLQTRIGIHLGLQVRIGLALGLDQRRIEQRQLRTAQRLDRVLDPKQAAAGDAGVLGALLGEAGVAPAQFGQLHQQRWAHHVAHSHELWCGQEPIGAARIAGDEDEVAVLRRARVPLEMLRCDDRPAVLVEPQKREIEVVAREVKVVGVAAKKRGLHLGRKDEPHVGIFAVGVELVLTAVIERDHLAAVDGIAALASLLLQIGNRPIARAHKVGPRLAAGRGIDRGRHIGDRGEDFCLRARALALVTARRREEAALQIVAAGGGQVLHAARDAVMIGQHQTFRRNERCRAPAREPHGTGAHAVEPCLVDGDAVFLLHRLGREIVEGPHAFVGKRRRERGESGDGAEEELGAHGAGPFIREQVASARILHHLPRLCHSCRQVLPERPFARDVTGLSLDSAIRRERLFCARVL